MRKEVAADPELRNFMRRRRDGRRLTVGTVHALQGDEKPIVILSMVISGKGPGTMQFMNRGRNLLNVAVSRAQRTLVVVGDRARMESEEGHWVRELWRHFVEKEKEGRAMIAKWTELLSLSNW
jgi:superfamily I DNA and/or RNA helicase